MSRTTSYLASLLVLVIPVLILAACGIDGKTPSSISSPNTSSAKTLSSLTISPATLSLKVGGTQQLTVTGKYSDGNEADVTSSATWATSNPAVATVKGGLVTALAPGTAAITAEFDNHETSETVTVEAPEFLFATDSNSRKIGSWQIDPGTGALTLVPGSPFKNVGGQPMGVAVDPTGRFLYVVNFVSAPDPGGITAYSIAVNGAPTAVGPEAPDTQQGGAGIRAVVDSTGAHAYVASGVSIGAAAYSIDSGTGALTPLNPQPFDFQSHHGTEDLAIINDRVYLTSAVGIDSQTINRDGSLNSAEIGTAHTMSPLNRLAVSGGKFLYATTVVVPPPGNPFAGPEPGHIYGWVVNSDGSLTPLASSPIALSGAQDIVASGNLLFASSPAGVSAYRVDPNSGVLSEISGSPFQSAIQLGELNIDHSGKFLYAIAGQQIAAFMIDNGGALSPVPGSPFSTGTLQPFALVSSP